MCISNYQSYQNAIYLDGFKTWLGYAGDLNKRGCIKVFCFSSSRRVKGVVKVRGTKTAGAGKDKGPR